MGCSQGALGICCVFLRCSYGALGVLLVLARQLGKRILKRPDGRCRRLVPSRCRPRWNTFRKRQYQWAVTRSPNVQQTLKRALVSGTRYSRPVARLGGDLSKRERGGETSKCTLGRSWGVFGRSWGSLGWSCGGLGWSCGILGAVGVARGSLGGSWELFGVAWGALGGSV